MDIRLMNVRQIVEEALEGVSVPQGKLDKLVRDLSDRVDAVRSKARQDGYRSGWDEGYQDGYDQGVSEHE